MIFHHSLSSPGYKHGGKSWGCGAPAILSGSHCSAHCQGDGLVLLQLHTNELQLKPSEGGMCQLESPDAGQGVCCLEEE